MSTSAMPAAARQVAKAVAASPVGQHPQQQQSTVAASSRSNAKAGKPDDQRLHRLPGKLFFTLQNNLALPAGSPIIKQVMPRFLTTNDILELEAKTNGNLLELSELALKRMSQSYGVTLSRLLRALRKIPESRQLLSLLGVPDLPLPPASTKVVPKSPLPHDMQRTHKYALIVSCQAYEDRDVSQLGSGSTSDLDKLKVHLEELGYRPIVLLNPSRSELLCIVDRLCCMLKQWPDTPPHLFLMLDGHGTIIHTPDGSATMSCFLPSDARYDQPGTYVRVEEELVRPLAACLQEPDSHRMDNGLLVAVFDMCRCLGASATVSTGAGGTTLHLGVSIQDRRIQRLHATGFAETAALVDNNKNGRLSFGVCALNKRLEADKGYEEQLRLGPFLCAVAETLRQMSQRYHVQSPEIQVCTEAKLSDLVLLTDKYSTWSANRVMNFVNPAWRKFALLIGAGSYKQACPVLCDLPCVRNELLKVQVALQLLGYHTVVCCDRPGGRLALLDLVRNFCRLLRLASGGAHPVQVVLLVDGHGELRSSGNEAKSLFLLPSDVGGNGSDPAGCESVDIELELAKPLLDAIALPSSQARPSPPASPLLLGFYDTCRSCSAPPSAEALCVWTFERPDYYRFFTTGVRQEALAQADSGSFRVRSLLGCIRQAALRYPETEMWNALQPSCLLNQVSFEVQRDTHLAAPGCTQLPNFTYSPSRTSLAEMDAYRIEDELTRRDVVLEVWKMRDQRSQ